MSRTQRPGMHVLRHLQVAVQVVLGLAVHDEVVLAGEPELFRRPVPASVASFHGGGRRRGRLVLRGGKVLLTNP